MPDAGRASTRNIKLRIGPDDENPATAEPPYP